MLCISLYILVYLSTRHNAVYIVGFCGAHRDAAVQDSVQPPVVQPPVESDDADPCPESEGEDYFQGRAADIHPWPPAKPRVPSAYLHLQRNRPASLVSSHVLQ
jgi:hypothetical protein